MASRVLRSWIESRFARSLCGMGLWLGTLFFAGSLTPSLIPRDALLQGVLSGASFALGYGIGVLLRALWWFLGLRDIEDLPTGRLMKLVAAAACIGIAALFLWRASGWQDSVRIPMGMPPVEDGRPLLVGMVAAAAALVLILVGRLFRLIARRVARRTRSIAPRRVSTLAGFVVAGLVFWGVGNGIILKAGIHLLDASYSSRDALMDDDLRQPADPLKTGSEASLIRWRDLGRMGRDAVSARPTRAEIEAFTGEQALEPLRIYVGLNTAESMGERVELAFAEMMRTGAFDRSILIITTPTGTGRVYPASQMPVEYLHRGDVATVVVQYSYTASWLTLMVDPTYGAQTARQLFRRVYDHWLSLPAESRPRLYLHGLSLGALYSDLSVDLFDVIGAPFQGALWSGPPFSSRTWRQATEQRHADSPAWLPRFRDGSVVRFTGQANTLHEASAPWGPLRIVYLQYASDPVTFFEEGSAFRVPAWMWGPRGPDVSPELRWYPLITFLQLGLDMMLSGSTPMGHGHVYAPEHYVDAWTEVTEPPGWTAERIEALKRHIRAIIDTP